MFNGKTSRQVLAAWRGVVANVPISLRQILEDKKDKKDKLFSYFIDNQYIVLIVILVF